MTSRFLKAMSHVAQASVESFLYSWGWPWASDCPACSSPSQCRGDQCPPPCQALLNVESRPRLVARKHLAAELHSQLYTELLWRWSCCVAQAGQDQLSPAFSCMLGLQARLPWLFSLFSVLRGHLGSWAWFGTRLLPQLCCYILINVPALLQWMSQQFYLLLLLSM